MALNPFFEPVDKDKHHLKGFNCGHADMNTFLARYASKNAQLGLSRTWVLAEQTTDRNKAAVAAYYTLAVQSICPEKLIEQGLPRYPTPVTLLARLAVDISYQKQGLGTKTLLAALAQAVRMADRGLPTYALILDVLDENALAFYQQFAFFRPLDDTNRKLFVPLRVIRSLLNSNQ
ncbi:hypothetical protein QV08_10555 [Gallibacterium salpingitidis]|uniref:N-acetyltransferase domain-containing protein n=1 Tax=Gallibacterium salpingitidis TaxID=505341 RepID=A0AB36E1P1_9PAST|nr:GNAT family N-acetyltransferase [Gallibacterium salpingitidis]OBX06343.1 hypothetical protein QV08_10555 [Gallibacterium salpingitidis]OBX09963.1 hypothetical protein QV09_07150 [Gallibacterium salpingitidis]WKT00638.1 GNAT family N-acetyltransferase [Gallibacterium salpingitidis]